MAAVIKGTTVEIGFGSLAYSGYVAESADHSFPSGNKEEIRDANGAMHTKILMDPITKLDLTVVILAAGSIEPPADGVAVSVALPSGTLTTFMSEGSSASHSAGATRLNLSLIKEDAMTYA